MTIDPRHILPALAEQLELLACGPFTARGRGQLIEQARRARQFAFERRARIERVEFREVLAALGGAPAEIRLPWDKIQGNAIGGVHPYCFYGALAAAARPATVLEFGTYLGCSALTIAMNCDATVYTVDLPEDGSTRTLTAGDRRLADDAQRGGAGRAFHGTPQQARIRQILADSLSLDVRDHLKRADLCVVDGGHSYACIKADTENALRVLAPGGVIVWDDYRWGLPGVKRYLEELARERPLRYVAGTQYVVLLDR